MKIRSALIAFTLAAALPILAIAQNNEASQAFMQANDKMMQAMNDMPMSGDPDMDFAMMMIPHHQGAIDMARVELEHGTDPKLREMAQMIIDAQKKEIAELNDWIKAQGH
jgi:uncharacterized protein (DUF305 family)